MEPKQPNTPDSEVETVELPQTPETPKTEIPAKKPKPDSSSSHWQRFIAWYKADKKKSIPLTVLVLIVLLAGIPWSRYHAAGLVLKKNLNLQIMDSTAHTPVSGASVILGSNSGVTDGSGKATLYNVPVGSRTVLISKKYYKDRRVAVLVPILSQKQTAKISFTATGRQAKVVISNLINQQKLSDVDIETAGIKAKTDKNGAATIVLPVGTAKQSATLSLKGYNDAKVTVEVSESTIKENNFKLTPAGKVYFLSKLSGKIDVVKTNLDGSGRVTVAAGTGKEDQNQTVLLASRDWQYLALLANRDGAQKVYIINANDDQLITMDQSNADFRAVGWSNHRFVYTVARHGFNSWQPNVFSIKSYNAENGQSLTLANSSASGSSNADAQYENIFDTLIVGDDVVFTRTWYAYPGYLHVEGKQDILAAIRADGSNNRQLKAVDAGNSYITNLKLHKPKQLYFGVYSQTSSPTTYFEFNNGTVSQSSTLTDNDLGGEATTYLQSPSGNNTFWAEERDGKNTLFIGDSSGQNGKQFAALSDFNVYGWYSDAYLLVSKKSSELYITSPGGYSQSNQPLKISDYHKPSQSFYGYGGGYGGI